MGCRTKKNNEQGRVRKKKLCTTHQLEEKKPTTSPAKGTRKEKSFEEEGRIGPGQLSGKNLKGPIESLW